MSSNTTRHDVVTCVVVLILAGSLWTGAGIASTETSHAGASGAIAATGDSSGVWTAAANDNETNVSIGNLSAPEQIRPGANYTVTATVNNSGDTFTVRQVAYRIAGNVVAVKWVPIPNGTTQTVTLNVTADRTSGFPNGTFAHGVFASGARETAELDIDSAAETTAEDRRTTQPDEEPTADSEPADVVRVRVTVADADGPVVTVRSATDRRADYVVVLDRRLRGEVVRALGAVLDSSERNASRPVGD